MPRATEVTEQNKLLHVLLIGPTKAGKTHWAMQAAEAGYNLIWPGSDNALQTISKFPDAAKERVFYMDFADTSSKSRMGLLTWALLKGRPAFLWNDSQQRMLKAEDDPNSAVWRIQFDALDSRTVLVIDTWTALAHSVMRQVATNQGKDLEDMEKADREVYGASGHQLTAIARTLQAAPCHVIVLAHPDIFEQRRKPKGKRISEMRESDMIIEREVHIPKSSSKPHGMNLGAHFSDVAWIEQSMEHSRRMIDFRTDPDRIIGGRFGNRKSSEEYSFKALAKALGSWSPSAEDPAPEVPAGFKIYGPGEYAKAMEVQKAEQAQSKVAHVLSSRTSPAHALGAKK